MIDEDKILSVVDEWAEQKKELFLVNHPKRVITGVKAGDYLGKADSLKDGVWVYYPWRFSLVHCLSKKEFIKLKTSRNFNLITPAEQRLADKVKIGIAGLNVGNPGAVCLGLTGVGSLIKLADIDNLSVSNLNRFRAGVCDLGVNKATLTARQIAEINPFVDLQVFDQGININELDKFLLKPKLDVLVEEMDDLALKIAIRERARYHRIPVVMVTGNCSNVIIDVERYDLDPKLKILNGLLDKKVEARIKKGIGSVPEKIVLARDFMGKKYLDQRLWNAFFEVGKTLAGIPQLAESSFLRGAAICHFARKLYKGSKLPSGRYFIEIDKIL